MKIDILGLSESSLAERWSTQIGVRKNSAIGTLANVRGEHASRERGFCSLISTHVVGTFRTSTPLGAL